MKRMESLSLSPFRRDESSLQFPHGRLHLVVPQSVDQGVQQWGDDGEGDGDGLIRGEGGEGPGVDVDAGHEVQGHHGDVGGADGDGFPPGLPLVRPQNPEDDCIRDEEKEEYKPADQSIVGNHQELRVKVSVQASLRTWGTSQ